MKFLNIKEDQDIHALAYVTTSSRADYLVATEVVNKYIQDFEDSGFNSLLQNRFINLLETYSSLLNKLNRCADYFLRDFFLTNKYQEMERLANKYSINMEILNDESFKKAYKKIALATHPDKTVGISQELREDMQKDFIKANHLLKQDTIASSEVYKPMMNKLYKANLLIKIADTSIDITKSFIKPTLENSLKVGIDCIQLSALYYGNYGITLPITGIGVLYQIYNGYYEDAIKSTITSVGITLMSTAIYTLSPALSVILTTGYTGYVGYTMLQNGHDLYYELQNMEITDNLEHNVTFEEL